MTSSREHCRPRSRYELGKVDTWSAVTRTMRWCTVHLNRLSVNSCTVARCPGQRSEVTTIEGPANDAELHPVQLASDENHALQWGSVPRE